MQHFCAGARECSSDQRPSAFEPSKVTETNSGTTITNIIFLQTVTTVVRERSNNERENVFEPSRIAETSSGTSIDSSSLHTVNTVARDHKQKL